MTVLRILRGHGATGWKMRWNLARFSGGSATVQPLTRINPVTIALELSVPSGCSAACRATSVSFVFCATNTITTWSHADAEESPQYYALVRNIVVEAYPSTVPACSVAALAGNI
jgi:hypothetical protein